MVPESGGGGSGGARRLWLHPSRMFLFGMKELDPSHLHLSIYVTKLIPKCTPRRQLSK